MTSDQSSYRSSRQESRQSLDEFHNATIIDLTEEPQFQPQTIPFSSHGLHLPGSVPPNHSSANPNSTAARSQTRPNEIIDLEASPPSTRITPSFEPVRNILDSHTEGNVNEIHSQIPRLRSNRFPATGTSNAARPSSATTRRQHQGISNYNSVPQSRYPLRNQPSRVPRENYSRTRRRMHDGDSARISWPSSEGILSGPANLLRTLTEHFRDTFSSRYGVGGTPIFTTGSSRIGPVHAAGVATDWEAIAAQLLDPEGFGSSPSEEGTYQQMSEIRPLPPAASGYTRSPKDDCKLICARCPHELGVGEDRVEKSVWVSRCGHVYCGDCANKITSARRRPRSRNTVNPDMERTTVCSVADCKTSFARGKPLWEVFL